MKWNAALILCLFLINGCSSNPTAVRGLELANVKFEQEYSPLRIVSIEHENGYLTRTVWAGDIGTTAFNQKYKDFVFDTIENNCGLTKSALKEVRVVSHERPTYYEVWVYHDQKNKKMDYTTGISVLMKYNEDTNKTDTSFNGECRK